jgi:hypothetical protein
MKLSGLIGWSQLDKIRSYDVIGRTEDPGFAPLQCYIDTCCSILADQEAGYTTNTMYVDF